jgi:hypothetical protein
MGKTVLLDHLAGQASSAGCRVAHVVGVQSEMELAFAGLHQLCAPMMDHVGRIPVPQHDALRTAFGLTTGPPPNRFLVGLSVLSLLPEVAGGHPLVCLVDDAQWLDAASAQASGIAAWRLVADPVGLVFGARDPGAELAGLAELKVTGLREQDARAVLDSVLAAPPDERVRDLIVAETRESAGTAGAAARADPAELAGGFGLPGAGAAGRPDRGQLRSPARGPARPDPNAGAARGGRPARRPGAGAAGGRTVGHPGPATSRSPPSW